MTMSLTSRVRSRIARPDFSGPGHGSESTGDVDAYYAVMRCTYTFTLCLRLIGQPFLMQARQVMLFLATLYLMSHNVQFHPHFRLASLRTCAHQCDCDMCQAHSDGTVHCHNIIGRLRSMLTQGEVQEALCLRHGSAWPGGSGALHQAGALLS